MTIKHGGGGMMLCVCFEVTWSRHLNVIESIMNCITKYFRVKCEASVQQLKHVPNWVTQQDKAQKEISGICYHGPFKVHMHMCINECLKSYCWSYCCTSIISKGSPVQAFETQDVLYYSHTLLLHFNLLLLNKQLQCGKHQNQNTSLILKLK